MKDVTAEISKVVGERFKTTGVVEGEIEVDASDHETAGRIADRIETEIYEILQDEVGNDGDNT